MYVVVVTCCIEMLSNSSLQLHLGSARTRKDKGTNKRYTPLSTIFEFSNRPDILLTLPVIKLVDFSTALVQTFLSKRKREKIQNIHPSLKLRDARRQFPQRNLLLQDEKKSYRKTVLNFFLSKGLRFNPSTWVRGHLRNGVRIVATCATLANPKDWWWQGIVVDSREREREENLKFLPVNTHCLLNTLKLNNLFLFGWWWRVCNSMMKKLEKTLLSEIWRIG